jgi:hypothetical protein
MKALFGLARAALLTCVVMAALYGIMVGTEKLMDRFGEAGS